MVSTLTLRQISAVLPPGQAWGLWLSRRIVAGIMDTFGPSLAGTRVKPIDVVQPEGRRVVGEWVRAPGIPTRQGAIYFVHGSGYALCSPRTHRRLTAWLSRLTGLPVFAVDAARLVALYSASVDPAHQRLTLDVAGGPPLPPTLIQAGGVEMLVADARHLAADIRAAGGNCELQVWPDQVHVFQALPRLAPEAAKAMAHIARFVDTSLQANDFDAAGKAG